MTADPGNYRISCLESRKSTSSALWLLAKLWAVSGTAGVGMRACRSRMESNCSTKKGKNDMEHGHSRGCRTQWSWVLKDSHRMGLWVPGGHEDTWERFGSVK